MSTIVKFPGQVQRGGDFQAMNRPSEKTPKITAVAGEKVGTRRSYRGPEERTVLFSERDVRLQDGRRYHLKVTEQRLELILPLRAFQHEIAARLVRREPAGNKRPFTANVTEKPTEGRRWVGGRKKNIGVNEHSHRPSRLR